MHKSEKTVSFDTTFCKHLQVSDVTHLRCAAAIQYTSNVASRQNDITDPKVGEMRKVAFCRTRTVVAYNTIHARDNIDKK